MKIKHLSLVAVLIIATLSCKKNKNNVPDSGPRAELTKDSIFLYAKQIYLWNDALPSYENFNPRKYTGAASDLENYIAELYDITQYKINPLTNRAYEYAGGTRPKYSYIEDIASKNPVAYIKEEKSAVDLEGNGNDFGLKINAYITNSTTNEFALFVTAVYQNSPADKASMVRSDRITKVNGRSVGANFNAEVDFLNNAFNSNSISIEGVKHTNGAPGATFSANLAKTVYKSNPIYSTKVLTAGEKKIGYLAYARFSSMSNSKAEFDAAFNTFNNSGVTELIIDLRYNSGGYVATAKYLIDHIAPATANGAVMFSEYYNSTMQNGQASILANQPLLDENGKVRYQNGKMLTYANVSYTVASNTFRFAKTGPLTNVTNVVFIVSGSTASSSELVINSLKPYMNVKLVGTTTYGKPVGFFPVTIENKYDVYYSLFTSKNSRGEGDYFNGFTPDIEDRFDDPFRNFGDPKENYLAKALNILAPGAVVESTNQTMSIGGKSVSVQNLLPMKPLVDGNEFVGMIDRPKLK